MNGSPWASIFGILLFSLLSQPACALDAANEATLPHLNSCRHHRSNTALGVVEGSNLMYNCALEAAVKSNALQLSIVDSCRADMGPGTPLPTMVWSCSKLRQYGSRMDDRNWRISVDEYCRVRANSRGNLYERKGGQCMLDTLIEQRQVPGATVAACRKASTVTDDDARKVFSCLLDGVPR